MSNEPISVDALDDLLQGAMDPGVGPGRVSPDSLVELYIPLHTVAGAYRVTASVSFDGLDWIVELAPLTKEAT